VLQAGRANLNALVEPLLKELEEAAAQLVGVLDEPAARQQVLKVGRAARLALLSL
jgi:hypothetical protein